MKKITLLSCLMLCLQICSAQTQVILAPPPKLWFPDNSGSRPLAFGCVFTYASGTTTPLATYTDFSGSTQNANPVPLNAGGFAGGGSSGIWIQAGQAYTLKVVSQGGTNCASGTTQYTVDGIGGGGSTITTVVTFSVTPTFVIQAQNQMFQMTLTGNAAANPLSAVGITPPSFVIFQLTQDATGNRTWSWPSNVIGGSSIGLGANQVTTQMFVWNGTNATAIGPANIGNGSSFSFSPGYLVISNSGTTGTTVNTLTKLTGAPSVAVIAAITDTIGIQGICVAGCSNAGSALIQTGGNAGCVFDGATVAGHYIQNSITTAGNCHDAGALYPSAGQVIGRVLSTNGATGTYGISLFGPEFNASGLGGTPGIAAGAMAGTSPTVTLTSGSTDKLGVISVVEGTAPPSNGVIATITLSAAFPTHLFCTFSPTSAAASLLTGIESSVSSTSTFFMFASSGSGITAGGVYLWSYSCGGN